MRKQVDTSFSGLTVEQMKQNGLKCEIKPVDNSFFMYEYDIYLEYDTSSVEGLMHWYYFKVMTRNIESGTKIRFNIRNLHRTRSLYENGMLPRIYYQNQESLPKNKKGWHVDPKVTYEIEFYKTN